MNRETIDYLEVWAAAAQNATTLEPGSVLSHCRIQRNLQSAVDGGAEPYVVWFEVNGASYFSALPRFQAKTRGVISVASTAAAAVVAAV